MNRPPLQFPPMPPGRRSTLGTCSTCKYFGHMAHPPGNPATICRRYPPRLYIGFVVNPQGGVVAPANTGWPAVQPDEGCGEHQVGVELAS